LILSIIISNLINFTNIWQNYIISTKFNPNFAIGFVVVVLMLED